jgi:murein DD-endopeptidase MepM/ murein hydrolase activator NlpD
MSKGTGIVAAVVGTVLVMCCGGVVVIPLMVGAAYGSAGFCGAVAEDEAPEGGFETWSADQVANAAAIVAAGAAMEAPPAAWTIALATAMQESTLLVHANDNEAAWPGISASLDYPHQRVGHDHDSVGLFQQRPAAGWGTIAELMDPATSATKFYNALLDTPGWESMSLTEAAQAVQVSAFPLAYADWEEEATALAAHLTGSAAALTAATDCDNVSAYVSATGEVDPAAWIAPVDATLWSLYQDPRRGGEHFGVDLGDEGAERGDPIRAAASGTVRYAECNSATCAIDGNPNMRGCGWMVVIDHGLTGDPYGYWPGVSTRYCHMATEPFVDDGDRVWAGQVIGVVGTTGKSGAVHLHYEVHLGQHGASGADLGRLQNQSSVDPVAFHEAHHAPLGRGRRATAARTRRRARTCRPGPRR